MMRSVVILCAMFALVVPEDASAQSRNYRSDNVKEMTEEDIENIEWDRSDDAQDRAREMIHDFIRCSVKGSSKVARAIARNEDSAFEEARERQFLSPRCLGNGGAVGLPDRMMRGVVAEVLIRREFGDGEPLDLSGIPEGRGAGMNEDGVFWRWDALGECLVREAPESVEALLDSDVASDDEREVLEAMTPQVAECMGMGGDDVLNPSMVRGGVAIAYFNLAEAHEEASE